MVYTLICFNAAIIIISKYQSLLALRFSLWWQERTRMTSSLFALIVPRWRFQAILWRSHWRNAEWRRCLFIRWDIIKTVLLDSFLPEFLLVSFSCCYCFLSFSQSHYKDGLQDGLQDSHLELDSPESDDRNSIMESRESSCDSRCSKSAMCSLS